MNSLIRTRHAITLAVLLALVSPLAQAAVELARFEGWWAGDGVVLEWDTGTEIEHGGFNLYRHPENLPVAQVGTQATKLNDSVIIEGQQGITACTPSGNSYQFEDTTAELAAGEYHYWLESINCAGGSEVDPEAHLVVPLPLRRIYLPLLMRGEQP